MKASTKTRIIVIAVAAIGLLSGAVFFVLNRLPGEEEATQVDSSNAAGTLSAERPAAGYYPDGENLGEAPAVVLTIDGEDISFDTYRCYFNNYVDYFQYLYGESCFEGENREQMETDLKEAVLALAKSYHYYRQLAERMGTQLTEEEQKAALVVAEDEFESMSMGLFYSNYDQYRQVALTDSLMSKARNEYYLLLTEENMGAARLQLESELESMAGTEHILLLLDSGVENNAENLEKLREEATVIYRQIAESDDVYTTFRRLRAEYDEDFNQPDEGYVFGPGEVQQAYYNAAIALEVGGVSEPVLVNDGYTGYHIIYRREIDDQTIAEMQEELSAAMAAEKMANEAQEAMDGYVVTFGSEYDNLNASTIK